MNSDIVDISQITTNFSKTSYKADCRRKVLIENVRAPFKNRTTEYQFSDFQKVQLLKTTREISHRNSDGLKSTRTVTEFSIKLVGGKKTLELAVVKDAMSARRTGEEIAKELEQSLEDKTSAEVVFRQAGFLDESLKDRMLRKGEAPDLETVVAPSGFNIHKGNNELILTLVPQGFTRMEHVMFLFFVGVMGLFPSITFVNGLVHHRASFGGFVNTVVVTGLVALCARAFYVARTTSRILTVDKERVCLTQHIPVLGDSSKTMKVKELEEIQLSGEKLILKSDKQWVSFPSLGEHASWMRDFIKTGLVHAS